MSDATNPEFLKAIELVYILGRCRICHGSKTVGRYEEVGGGWGGEDSEKKFVLDPCPSCDNGWDKDVWEFLKKQYHSGVFKRKHETVLKEWMPAPREHLWAELEKFHAKALRMKEIGADS